METKKLDLGKEDISKLFRIRKNVLKMLEDRGYTVSSKEMSESYESFRNRVTNRSDLVILCQRSNADEYIFVEFYEKQDKKIGVQQINEFGLRISNQNIKNGIMILSGGITTLCKNAIQDLSLAGINIETFDEKELIVNITEHELVPKHTILSQDEKNSLLAKYKLKENQLPKILLSDPISKYLGLRRAQVVKIIRPSETAGRYVTFRIAV